MHAQQAFGSRTVSALGWSGGQQIGEQLIQIVIGIVLARLLSPEEFGLVGMVVVITGFATLFVDVGFGAALIQRRDPSDELLDSVFWINVAAGTALTLLVFAVSPLVAEFYHEPQLVGLTRLMSVTFLTGSLASVQRSLLTRALDFRAMALAGWVGRSAIAGVAVLMATRGCGAFSLATYTVGSAAVTTATLWHWSTWRPRLRFRSAEVRAVLGFSTNYFGFQAFNYWARNADNLLIGRFLGTDALGLYSRAYTLMLFPLRQVAGVVARVLFPALSTIQDDRARVGRVYLLMCQSVAVLTAPLMFGLAVLAAPFVLMVLGGQWMGSVPLIRLLAFVGFLQSVGTLVGSLYLSQGRSELMFRVGGIVAVAGVISIIVGLPFGVVGVATAYAVMSALVFVPQQVIALRLVGLGLADLVRTVIGPTAAAACMALVLLVLQRAVMTLSAGAQLMLLIPTGALVYGLCLTFLRVEALGHLTKLVSTRAWLRRSRIVW